MLTIPKQYKNTKTLNNTRINTKNTLSSRQYNTNTKITT